MLLHIVNLNPQESEIIQAAFKNIIEEHERKSTEKNLLLGNLIYILLLRIREIYRPRLKEIKTNSSSQEQLANGFRLLVEQYFIEYRTVNDYAEKLFISAKHLSEVVRETFGRSPLQTSTISYYWKPRFSSALPINPFLKLRTT